MGLARLLHPMFSAFRPLFLFTHRLRLLLSYLPVYLRAYLGQQNEAVEAEWRTRHEAGAKTIRDLINELKGFYVCLEAWALGCLRAEEGGAGHRHQERPLPTGVFEAMQLDDRLGRSPKVQKGSKKCLKRSLRGEPLAL